MRKKVVQRKKAVFVGTFIEGISLIFTCTRLVFHVGGFFDGNNFGSFPPPQNTEDEGSGHTLPNSDQSFFYHNL